MKDTLGDQLKLLERAAQPPRLDPALPIYARIDGHGFSRFTKGMSRPFDLRMTRAMAFATRRLVEKTHASAGYVQSDEISLLWLSTAGGEAYFGGKPYKLTSILAGIATAAFTKALLLDPDGLDAFADREPHFDCRVVQPGREDAVSFFRWRGQDARRNAISQIAQAHFSHRTLQGKSTQDMKDMLASKNIGPDDFDPACLNGTLMLRRTEQRSLTPEELGRIPEEHRPDPGALFDRSVLRSHTASHPGAIGNLDEVLFEGALPE